AVNNCGQTIMCPAYCTDGVCLGNDTCCVPDNFTACNGVACGSVTNNCGQTVTCPNTCNPPSACGTGDAGANACASSCPSPNCGTKLCGAPDDCGGTCNTPDSICQGVNECGDAGVCTPCPMGGPPCDGGISYHCAQGTATPNANLGPCTYI